VQFYFSKRHIYEQVYLTRKTSILEWKNFPGQTFHGTNLLFEMSFLDLEKGVKPDMLDLKLTSM